MTSPGESGVPPLPDTGPDSETEYEAAGSPEAEAVLLFHRDLGGDGPPLVILHGLFGSSRNWVGVGRRLRSHAHVYAVDQRNHGDSPHTATHTLAGMSADLALWIRRHCSRPPILLGHSMGGLTIMHLALHRPELAAALVVVDIAPVSYPFRHEEEFAALSVDISALRSRDDLDRVLAPLVPDEAVRRFLSMNARRVTTGGRRGVAGRPAGGRRAAAASRTTTSRTAADRTTTSPTAACGGGFHWTLNTAALKRSTVMQEAGKLRESGLRYPGPALFVGGGRSPYLAPATHKTVRRLFPRARIEIIPGEDHWLHYSAADRFVRLVAAFLDSLSGSLSVSPSPPHAPGESTRT